MIDVWNARRVSHCMTCKLVSCTCQEQSLTVLLPHSRNAIYVTWQKRSRIEVLNSLDRPRGQSPDMPTSPCNESACRLLSSVRGCQRCRWRRLDWRAGTMCLRRCAAAQKRACRHDQPPAKGASHTRACSTLKRAGSSRNATSLSWLWQFFSLGIR